MAEDASNLVPRCWQTIYPYPLAGEAPGDTARRRRRVDRQFRAFGRLAPELQKVHPLGAEIPQECSEITAHVFRSPRLDTIHYVPSYSAWLDSTGHLEAYRFHKRFLQHMQHQSGAGRCVLKCPEHVFALDPIMEVYPDAHFVLVHRDPLHILASVARLTEILRAPFSRHIDRRVIGRQVAERWVDGAVRIVEAARDEAIPAGRVFHVHHEQLVGDPFGTVAAIYRCFGMELSDAATERIGSFVAERPHGDYGQNEYRLEEYGLDADDLRGKFRGYTEYFGIEPKAPSRYRVPASAA
jgi:hypothetical protein